ncbi:coat protein, P22 domain protein [Leptospira kirschneri]|uniref:P22 phage major capsid protein family protein n=1 Tax=Leptospira kirschneri TaxID=29507 RepID=UPI0002BE849F|nr:P22 phage major capsid protein family protein [Leptospira kirschneri]EMK02924.1 coat protein, P22 domain protein [Leptospira kirschneri]
MIINSQLLFPEFWFTGWDLIDQGILNFQNQVSRSIETTLSSSGKSVTVPIQPDMGDADDYDVKNPPPVSNFTQRTIEVSLTQRKKKTIELNSEELSLSPYSLIENYAAPMALSIYRSVNKFIYTNLLKTSNIIDGRSSFDKSTLIALRTMMSNNKVTGTKNLVVSPDDYGNILSIPELLKANESGSSGAIQNGIVATALGFNISENHTIETYTPADLVGAINYPAGYTQGETKIVVNGFIDSANPLKVGDVFKIAGETGSPFHAILNTTVTAGNTTEITFDPPLRSAVPNLAAVTITPTKSLVGFTPSAFAFAARAYNQFPAGTGVNSAVAMLAGLPIRISVWVEGLILKVQYDLLYGGEVVNANRIARIIT